MRIKAAKIGLAKIHREFESSRRVPGVTNDVSAGQHLLHDEGGPRPAFVSPIMLVGIPLAGALETQRLQVQRVQVGTACNDISGYVRLCGIQSKLRGA